MQTRLILHLWCVVKIFFVNPILKQLTNKLIGLFLPASLCPLEFNNWLSLTGLVAAALPNSVEAIPIVSYLPEVFKPIRQGGKSRNVLELIPCQQEILLSRPIVKLYV